MITAAIVGFGLSGRNFHLPLLHATGFSVTDIVVNDPERHSRPDGVRFRTFEEVCVDAGVDMVVVCTPNDQHFAQAQSVLQAGKHLIVEKPLTTNASDARALTRLAANSGKVAAVFHSRRWDGDFLTLQRILAGGQVGEWQVFESRWGMNKPLAQRRWKDNDAAGGGLLKDFMPHLVDQALTLFGLPDRATADVAVQRAGGVGTDYATLTLSYGAKRAVLATDCFSYSGATRFRLAGTEAEYTVTGADEQEAQLRAGISPRDAEFGAPDPRRRSILASVSGHVAPVDLCHGRYIGFYAAMREAISRGNTPPVTLDQASSVIEIMDALQKDRYWDNAVDLHPEVTRVGA